MKHKDKSIIKFKYNKINVDYIINYRENCGNNISFIFGFISFLSKPEKDIGFISVGNKGNSFKIHSPLSFNSGYA